MLGGGMPSFSCKCHSVVFPPVSWDTCTVTGRLSGETWKETDKEGSQHFTCLIEAVLAWEGSLQLDALFDFAPSPHKSTSHSLC